MLLIITTIACGSSQNKQYFDIIKHGHTYIHDDRDKKVVMGILSDRKTCIYGKPNKIVKQYIEEFYEFLFREFAGFEKYMYVHLLEECPKDTSIYIFLYTKPFKQHEKAKKRFIMRKLYSEYKEIVNIQNISTPAAKLGNPIAFANLIGDGSKTMTSFIAVNQAYNTDMLSDEEMQLYKPIFRTLILTEIYQSMSHGRDLPIRGKPMSILQETNNTLLRGTALSSYAEHNKKLPQGLCEYDLWHLLLSNEIPGAVLWDFDKYKSQFQKNQVRIKA